MRGAAVSQRAIILRHRIRGHLRIQAPAYAVLVGSLVLTLLAWRAVVAASETRARAAFDASVTATSRAIDRRIDTYINAMFGARGLLTVAGTLSTSDWRAFVESSQLEHRYPGMQAFGYTALVAEGQQDAFVAEVRRQGNPAYALQIEEPAPVYYPIRLVEPLTPRNAALLGYDMHAAAEYRIAMDEARDTGMPYASARVTIPPHAGQEERVGFVICLPVYRSNQPTSTVPERQAALQGFIVTIFAADDLAAAIFGPFVDPQVDFEVFDGPQMGPDNLLHDHDGLLHVTDPSYRPKFARTTTLDVAGRPWTLNFTAPSTFDSGDGTNLSRAVLAGGSCLSLFLFVIIWLHGSSRAAAERVGAERADVIRELEAFSYSVSHDLRAPLRRLDGFRLALLEDYGEQLDPRAHDYLRRMRVASERMSQLIDAQLDLARLSRQETRRDWIDLSALARAVAEELQRTQPQRRVEWLLADGLRTQGDPQLLRIVLENLLGNAWKFTRTVPVPRIEFGWVLRDNQGAYFVRDNGAGFDMTYADKLFGAFQRLHSTAEFEGTGIGLATVRRAVHRHGGHVWAEGAPGQGATIFFTLALTPPRGRRAESARLTSWRRRLPHRSRDNRAERYPLY